NAGAVARQDQPLTIRVPDCNRIIAFDLVDEIKTAFFVQMKDGFGISARSVDVAFGFQSFTQRSVVVNLAVENQPDSIRAAVHWLMTRFGKIDYRQPAKAKATTRIVED